MTYTADFEIELLKEKNKVITSLLELKQYALDQISYLDKKCILDYHNQLDMIIFAIDKEYEEIRKRGKPSVT